MTVTIAGTTVNRNTKVDIPRMLLLAAIIKTWFKCEYSVYNKNMTGNIAD